MRYEVAGMIANNGDFVNDGVFKKYRQAG